jgi:hypothetical protein
MTVEYLSLEILSDLSPIQTDAQSRCLETSCETFEHFSNVASRPQGGGTGVGRAIAVIQRPCRSAPTQVLLAI